MPFPPLPTTAPEVSRLSFTALHEVDGFSIASNSVVLTDVLTFQMPQSFSGREVSLGRSHLCFLCVPHMGTLPPIKLNETELR